MDVMLRFDGRDATLERELEARGFEIIIPRNGRATDQFQIVLHEVHDETWSHMTGAAEDALCLIASLVAARPEQVGGAVDFGFSPRSAAEAGIAVFTCKFRPSFLELLADLRLALATSVWTMEHEPVEREAPEG